MNRPGYVDVDALQEQTTLEAAAAKCGVTLDAKGSGPEIRIDCPFGCVGDHAGRREVAINTNNAQKVFMCHAYQCKFRGNLLTLMYGWLTGSRPTGDKLKGEEFRRVTRILAGASAKAREVMSSVNLTSTTHVQPDERNIPLIDSPDVRIRELHNIDEKFLRDVASLNPAAATYVRQHPCLSPESMKKWRVGYLPNDGGGDKRGWSLRGSILYPMFSEQGKVLAWIGRDVNYEEKEKEFSRLLPNERAGKEPPAKHRFPKGFHRGQELFGQQSSRLKEPGYREFVARHGVIVVEGFNDVIALDNMGIPAVAIMSNRMTVDQATKVEQWANRLCSGNVILLFDADQPGDEGAKEALWLLTQRGLNVALGWSQAMFSGKFRGRQPDTLQRDELELLLLKG